MEGHKTKDMDKTEEEFMINLIKMKKYYLRLTLVFLALVFVGCSAKAPTPIKGEVSIPKTFNSVWYRPTLDKPGFLVMTDTGTLTVKNNFIKFVGENETKMIAFSDIISISFEKLGSDFINEWVVIKYGKETSPLYAVMSAGENIGWSGGSGKIFSIIEYVIKKNNFTSVKIGN